MEDLIKGESDWHNKVNSNFRELAEKAGVVITEEDIPVAERKKGAVYFVVTDQAPTTNETIKVSPTMGVKTV
ncbi:hypothetical protein [Clostridium sp. 001]|uniref:hypothetical protein n=1 Tax=Clostridium sp. 001 TaxID=1970093 RepID=UPI001C2C677F|nr:hypothetical protein [Clostridium sp. 001]QXE20457.1 hypothetical protein B5S50_17320 [Clostridium sp. 001]